MQSHIRRQIQSFIIPQKEVIDKKKKQPTSMLTINKKQQQIGKNLTVHQFDEAVNLIFRPKRFLRPNKPPTRPNPLTDRNPHEQKSKQQKEMKSSSFQKSFSLLKKIKDFIVPQNFSFLKFNKTNQQKQSLNNDNLYLSIQSKLSDRNKKQNFSKQQIQNKLPNVDLVAQKRVSGLSITSNDEQFFIIPQLKISLPKQSSKEQQSSSRRSSRIIQANQLNEVTDERVRKNSLMSSIFSSKRSQKSQHPKLSSPAQSLSKITNPNFNLLKTEHIEGQKLKYFYILGHSLTQISTTIYVLIGNENQIDCLCMSRMAKQNIVDIELAWSLNLQRGDREKGKISSVAFDSLKSSYITLLSNDMKVIEIYRYSTKQFTKTPTFIAHINIQSPIHTMHMIKQNQIILFYQSKLVEVYSIELHSQVKKKYQKQLDSKIQVKKNFFNQLEILSIGQPFMNSITVYLSCDQSQTANPFLFDLFIIEISFHGQGETIMSKPHRVYSIKKDLKPLLKFDNFSSRFFLLYVGLEVIAVMKQGYMIDSAKVDIQQEKSMLKYVGRNRLLLITQSKIQQYEFNLNEDTPPYRLHIKSLDSILLPENYDSRIYEFLDAMPIFQSINTNKSLFQPTQFFTFYLLCFQLKYDQNRKVLTGQVPYILTMTKPVSVKQKADKLFHFEGRNIQTVDIKEIQQKVDIAKKMGLKVKDIYLDLWNRTKKNTVKDFCFLLDTLDYEVISKEIQKKLKKQAMVYTELTKIENSCFFLLKKKVFSPECTETDIKNFIVSHFKLKKYYFFKDVSKFCENQQAARDQLKKPQKPVSSQSSLKSPHSASITESQRERREREEKKLMFDIQAFYTYNQMELKSYLLQLFHRYFYQISQSPSYISKGKQVDIFKYAGKFPLIWAKKKDYLLKIKIMMNNFRFQLKIIYEEFLQELIKLTEKGDMIIELLNDFEEILPRSFTGHFERPGQSLEQVKDDKNQEDQIRVTKRIEILQLKRSLSKSTHGELQLEGIWRDIPEIQFQNYLYLQNIETIYNKTLIQNLSKDIWFKRNLYSQHDLILKTKQEILEIDRKLKSSYIFYFFIDRVYEYVTNQTVRKDVIQLIDHNYSSVLPKHLKGKIQLYYQLYLQTKKLSKQYVETLHKQAKNPINQSAGLRTSTLNIQGPSTLNFFLNLTQQSKMNPKSNQEYKKSLYQTFLPQKSTEKTNHLDSFQNFLKLSQIQLFSEFIKLEYILVGCIFHRIKPVYEKFWKGREIFNQTVQKYFQSKNSEISHLKCLLNRLNSQSKEFQAQHFDLYEVLVKSVMVKVEIGSMIPQKEYVNVDQLIIYIRDVYMVNQNKINNKKELKSHNFGSGKNSPDQIFSNSKLSGFGLQKLTPRSIDFDPFLSNPPRQSKIQTFFNILGCVSENKQLFRNLKIRISLFDIYGLHLSNSTQTITTLIVQYLIEHESFYELGSYQQFQDKTIELLIQAAMILNKLYTSPENFIKKQMDFPLNEQKTSESQNFENQLFFILLWKIMSHERYVYNGWIFRLLSNKDIANTYRVNEILKENLVIFMCKYRFSLDKLFVNNIQYLECLINLLPEANRIRKYFASQIQFVKAIQPNYQQQKLQTKFQCHNVKPKIMNPLTQNSEIISIFHIEQIFSLYPSQYLLKLNLEKICQIVNEMQKILLEVAVKQRLADHHEFRNGQSSLIQSMDEKQAGFGRFERDNSGKFLFSMKKSLDLIEDRQNFFSGCNTPIYTPQFQTPFVAAASDKEINLLELETLIRQSAQPHTFFKETETKLIKSVKLIRERGSLAFQSPQKQQQRQKVLQQKQIQQSIAQLQNLSQYYTSLTQIYEVVVKRLINSQMIKQVLGHLQKLLKLSQLKDQKVNQFYVVYPLLILNIISRQLIPQNRILLVKICSHLFKEPLQLLKFIKQLIGKKDKQIIDLSQLQSSVIFFSMTDLNRKLIDYEKKTRFYKFQYTGIQKELDLVDESDKKIQKIQKPKYRPKKNLTIKIEDEQESAQIQLPNKFTQNISPKDEVQYMKRPFSYQNPIIAAHCIDTISSQPQKLKFIQHIWTLFETLHRQKELFSKDFQFMIMNVMLFQQPYTIVKYLETKLKSWYFAGLEQSPNDQTNLHTISSNVMLKFKPLMSYFNEMIKEPCINPLRLLQFGKRMFYMLYCTIVERSSIEYQISQYYEVPLTQIIPCDEFPDSPISQIYTIKFKHSIEAFSKKQKQIRKKMTQSGKFMPQVSHAVLQTSKKSHQINLFIKQVNSYEDFSPNKYSAMSKEDLLEISYNNIDDSLSQNLQTPLVAHNPSKLSQFSKGEESFDPSKQRELVYSRGQKRFSAMLSNNSSIVLKNKLSPKSIKSGNNSSMKFFSSENSKIKKKNDRYFLSDKDIKKVDIRKKKTFDGMTQIEGSNEQIVYNHEESIIFQQDYQKSRNVSEVDIHENFCIQPPKLINKETDRLFNSSSLEDSKNVQRSRNLVTEEINLCQKNQNDDQFRWTQRNKFQEQVQEQFFSTMQPSPQKNQQKKFESGFNETKEPQVQKKKEVKPQMFIQIQESPSPIKSQNNKKDQNQINIILQEDQFGALSLKQASGCEYDADITVTHNKIQQNPKNPIIKRTQKQQKNKQILPTNAPIKRTSLRNNLTKNIISEVLKEKQIKQQKFQVQVKQHTIKSDKSLESPPRKKVSIKKDEKNTNSPNLELSNQVRKFSKSINQQKSDKIEEFTIPHDKEGLIEKSNDTKFKRKIQVQTVQETFKSATETKKQTRKILTVQIPPSDDVIQLKKPQRRYSSQIQSEKIPVIIISPRHRSTEAKPAFIKNFVPQNSAKQNHLLIKIRQTLTKNGLQMFLLTELEDIFEKFRDYLEKYEDIIPGMTGKYYQNQSESGGNQTSRLSQKSGGSNMNQKKVNNKNDQKQSTEPRSLKVNLQKKGMQQDVSLQLSHSHQSYEHEHEQIELFTNWQNGNHILQQEVLFTKEQLYELMLTYLNDKIKQTQSQQQQLPESQILLQQLKDKLFYDICMQRLLQNFTNENNVNTIAKIIDKVFGKKIFVTDYYYEVISKKEVQQLQKIVEKVAEQATVRTFRYTSTQTQNKPIPQKQPHSKITAVNKFNNLSQKSLSPRANSVPKKSALNFDQEENTLEKSLETQMNKLQNLLQKIPLNILQYRKKQLMLKLKPGKQMGRKYLLDVLVKVFEKKKDKKLAQEIHLRLKNIIDKDIKM